TTDSGWAAWDLEVYSDPWTNVHVCTTQEEHGSGKRLIRVRFSTRLHGHARVLAVASILALLSIAAREASIATLLAVLFGAGITAMKWRGCCSAARVVDLIDATARELRLMRCDSSG